MLDNLYKFNYTRMKTEQEKHYMQFHLKRLLSGISFPRFPQQMKRFTPILAILSVLLRHLKLHLAFISKEYFSICGILKNLHNDNEITEVTCAEVPILKRRCIIYTKRRDSILRTNESVIKYSAYCKCKLEMGTWNFLRWSYAEFGISLLNNEFEV